MSRPMTTLRITSNREQFMSCPLANVKVDAQSIKAWERDRGKAIRVYLPPLEPGIAACGGRAWQIVPEEIKNLTNIFEHASAYICEHEVELD